MLIDCTTCVARDVACGDCVISVLLAGPPPRRSDPLLDLDDAERRAIGHLANAGLVPPLRLVEPVAGIDHDAQAPRMSGNDREIA